MLKYSLKLSFAAYRMKKNQPYKKLQFFKKNTSKGGCLPTLGVVTLQKKIFFEKNLFYMKVDPLMISFTLIQILLNTFPSLPHAAKSNTPCSRLCVLKSM